MSFRSERLWRSFVSIKPNPFGMKTPLTLLWTLLLVLPLLSQAQESRPDRLKGQELSLNFFRNPSIGLEYRRNHFSVHTGYYPTIFSSNGASRSYTNSFWRTGVSLWYLPWGQGAVPSSLYSSVSWARGLDFDYKNQNTLMLETGARLHIWQGLQVRLGVVMSLGADQATRVNPTPSVNYSFQF